MSVGSLKAEVFAHTAKGDWIDPLWRSAICPGWGQEYNGSETKAWVIGGTTWGLFAGVVGTYIWAVKAEDNYSFKKGATYETFNNPVEYDFSGIEGTGNVSVHF
jgi:hypothetical protein